MKIEFSVKVASKKGEVKDTKTLYVDDKFPKELLGDYVVRELTAQEAINVENDFIMENKEAQDNPDKQDLVDSFQVKMIEAATTLNGQPFKMPKLDAVPKKYYHLLVSAFEKLNGISNAEARFLLQPSS